MSLRLHESSHHSVRQEELFSSSGHSGNWKRIGSDDELDALGRKKDESLTDGVVRSLPTLYTGKCSNGRGAVSGCSRTMEK